MDVLLIPVGRVPSRGVPLDMNEGIGKSQKHFPALLQNADGWQRAIIKSLDFRPSCNVERLGMFPAD